jgi:hypothetical protein
VTDHSQTELRRRRQISKPVAIAGFALFGLIVLMGDDIAALLDQAQHAPWMFSAPEQRPTGTWQGEFLGRTITLHLEPDTLSNDDSGRRRGKKNGFFYKRLELERGIRTVQGTLTSPGQTEKQIGLRRRAAPIYAAPKLC